MLCVSLHVNFFMWFVYCGVFLDCIECAECNVSDREECTLINDKKASATHIPTLFYYMH